jgi:hypothetical protein
MALGWHVFPYSVNGIFLASLGNVNFGDFDPTSLMPSIWIGEVWCDIAFLFFPIQILMSAILILMTMSMMAQKNLTRPETLQISLFLITTVLSFVILPGYLARLDNGLTLRAAAQRQNTDQARQQLQL